MIIKDFLWFRRMLTPMLIQILFWLGVIACLITGISNMIHHQWIRGLEIFFIGPLLVRVACELLILFFRINETLTDIKNSLRSTE